MTTVRQKEAEIQHHAKGVTAEELAKIRERARELAMNQGRSAHEPNEEDWIQAEREFLCLQTSLVWDERFDRVCKEAEASR
jgi:hypothetical protein